MVLFSDIYYFEAKLLHSVGHKSALALRELILDCTAGMVLQYSMTQESSWEVRHLLLYWLSCAIAQFNLLHCHSSFSFKLH